MTMSQLIVGVAVTLIPLREMATDPIVVVTLFVLDGECHPLFNMPTVTLLEKHMVCPLKVSLIFFFGGMGSPMGPIINGI